MTLFMEQVGNMNIYFGKAEKDESTQDLFEHEGEYFYYKISLEQDQFVIHDTCNRYVPLDYTAAKPLFQAIKYMYQTESAKRSAEAWLAKSLGALEKMYGIKTNGSF